MSELSSEMYSDRLMAQDYIYSLMKILYERKFRLADQNLKNVDGVFRHDRIRILSLLTEFEKTKLTTNENIQFQEFKKNVLLMMLSEQKYFLSGNKDEKTSFLAFQNKSLTVSLEQLDELAKIQLAAGKQLNESSKQIVTFSSLLNQFDWAVIIIIGLIIQAIIFASRSSIPKGIQNQFLN